MHDDHFNTIPSEVRLFIFRLATLKVRQHEDKDTHYSPLQAVSLKDRDWSYSTQEALNVKMSLVCVCRDWRKIGNELLYECIRIRHGSHQLLDALKNNADTEFDCARWVRRIEISPEILDFDPFNPSLLVDILKCCRHTDTIVRPCLSYIGGTTLGSAKLPSNSPFPTLPNIRRIDWWLPGVSPQPGCAGFVVDLITHSTNLEYLTFASSGSRTIFSGKPNLPTWRSPSLTTLRLEIESPIPPDPHPHYLPNLTHLLLSDYWQADWPMISNHSAQIRVLEFVIIESISAERETTASTLADTLSICNNIEELVLHLRMPVESSPASAKRIRLEKLTTLRIKFDSTTAAQSVNLANFVRRLETPALDNIVLHGPMSSWIASPCYPLLKQYVSSLRYCSFTTTLDGCQNWTVNPGL